MSFDDLRSSLPTTEIVEFDVRVLGPIAAESEQIHADDSELLARLECANTMASEVETRLDEILGTLDDLLTHLEPKNSDKLQQAVIPHSSDSADPPPSPSYNIT